MKEYINTLRKYRNRLIWGVLIGGFCIIILISVSTPNHFKDGMEYINEGEWDLALQSFSKVENTSNDLDASLEGIAYARAHIEFQSGLYSNALRSLEGIMSFSRFSDEAVKLRDSVRIKMNNQLMTDLMSRLSYYLQNDVESDSTLTLLATISPNYRYQEYVKTHFPNAVVLIKLSAEAAKIENTYRLQLRSLKSELAAVELKLSEKTNSLNDLLRSRISFHKFTITGVVTTASGDEKGDKNLEDGANLALLDYTKEVALIDRNGDKIPNGSYLKTYSFAVRPLGIKYFLRSGATGWYRVGKGEAFEIVDTFVNPSKLKNEVQKLTQKRNTLANSISKIHGLMSNAYKVVLAKEKINDTFQ